MALTTQGIEEVKKLTGELSGIIQDISQLKSITATIERDPNFSKFINSTQVGRKTMDQWMQLTSIVGNVSELMNDMCHNTLEYAKVQEGYNNNDFSYTPNYTNNDSALQYLKYMQQNNDYPPEVENFLRVRQEAETLQGAKSVITSFNK